VQRGCNPESLSAGVKGVKGGVAVCFADVEKLGGFGGIVLYFRRESKEEV
jgi:hypothetical protein